MRRIVVVGTAVIALATLAGCANLAGSGGNTLSAPPTFPSLATSSQSDSGNSGNSGSDVTRLSVSYHADPAFGDGYQTSGSYVQVSGIDGLGAVNTALRDLIVDDQKRDRTTFSSYGPGPAGSGPGIYSSQPDKGSVSASSAVVSVLIPTDAIFPGGNDGSGWLSSTLLVPSAGKVTLDQLWADSSGAGLDALATAASAKVLASNPCIAQQEQQEGDANGTTFGGGIAPTARNYANFALTPSGLAIGFAQGQLAAEACDTTKVVVPWSTLRPYLSATAKQLITELR